MSSPFDHRVLALALLAAALLLLGASCRSAPVKPTDGHLPPCPDSPNCVNTQTGDVEPLTFAGSGAEALARLRAIIEDMPRTTIREAADGYLHAEFRSALFRFVDDVQCLVDENAGVIHLRSASRLGYSDLGVNRRRLEALRAAWSAEPAS